MPEPRRVKFIPRLGKRVSITFGDPIQPTNRVRDIVGQFRENREKGSNLSSEKFDLETRIELTRYLQEEVEGLGRSARGSMPVGSGGSWPTV